MAGKNSGQMSLFGDPNWRAAEEEISGNDYFAEVSRTSVSLSLASSVERVASHKDAHFVLSRRWEQCVAQASSRDNYEGLLNIVRPVVEAQDQLWNYIRLMQITKEGALWVFYGPSGSGKTTFLSSLEHQFNADIDQLQAIVLKADDLNLRDRSELRTNLIHEIQKRKSREIALVLILEDREDSIDDVELASLTQTLKSILRSPTTGENVLMVFPVNNIGNGRRIIQAAQDVGIQQQEGARNTIFTFQGPDHRRYVDIVEDLALVLNGRPISSFGIHRGALESMPKERITVGEFIQNVAERIQREEGQINAALERARYKELVMIFAFVRPLEPTELYTSTQQIVVDSYNRINPSWLLSEGSELSIRDWKNYPERFATVVNGVLHVRVVDFPPHVLYQIIQVYGSDEQRMSLDDRIRNSGLDPEPTKNQANSRQAVDATNLAKLLRGEPTSRIKKTPLEGDKPEEELSDTTQQARNLIRKGIETARWVPTYSSVTTIHASIARAFKDLITRGNLRTRVNGYIGVWREATLVLENDIGIQKTVKPDITVETNDTLYLIEFSFGSQTVLTRADMANYILKKIDAYSKQLPVLSQLRPLGKVGE